MKLAFFSTSLPEPGRKPGGVDVHVQRLAERLAGRGHQVDLYTFSPSFRHSSYRHRQLRPQSIRYGRLSRMMIVPMLLNFVGPTADVLHLHGDDWFFVRRRLPTVRTFYGSALWEARTAERLRRRIGSRAIFLLEILASRLATASYDIVPGAGKPFATRGTLPPAIAVDPVEAVKAEHPTILFVGTWGGRKRGRLLAEVFSREVRPKLPDARLVMVSDHVEPAPGIAFIDRPSDRELGRHMRQAWVMCLPSSYEGFGIPYIEAMAAGTAVVASPNVGSRFVLENGRAGIIASDDQLGPTLLRVLTDEKLRALLEERGRTRVSAFTWERVLDLHERAYEEAMASWRSRRSPCLRASASAHD